MSEAQKPSVGRIVHVFCRSLEYGSFMGIGPYPAIVLKVHADGVSICAQAFPAQKLSLDWSLPVPFSDKDGNEGRDLWWEWPERV